LRDAALRGIMSSRASPRSATIYFKQVDKFGGTGCHDTISSPTAGQSRAVDVDEDFLRIERVEDVACDRRLNLPPVYLFIHPLRYTHE